MRNPPGLVQFLFPKIGKNGGSFPSVRRPANKESEPFLRGFTAGSFCLFDATKGNRPAPRGRFLAAAGRTVTTWELCRTGLLWSDWSGRMVLGAQRPCRLGVRLTGRSADGASERWAAAGWAAQRRGGVTKRLADQTATIATGIITCSAGQSRTFWQRLRWN